MGAATLTRFGVSPMLLNLSIRDIVLIEQAEIPFAEGLCVLSGETGAGKSILLDALGLALGQRAEARLVRSGKEQGVVTAEFSVGNHKAISALLNELGIVETDGNLVIRRILMADGKGRCFINDQPVSVTALKAIGDHLVEIHGQHDQRGLLDPSIHRGLLDDFGGYAKDLGTVQKHFHTLRTTQHALAALQDRLAKAQAEEDYLRHSVEELSGLEPVGDEEETLASKRQAMMGGEKRLAALQSAVQELQGSHSVADSIHTAIRLLSRSNVIDARRIAPVLDMLERAGNDVNEALAELEKIADESQFSPQELDRIEERLFALRACARKHQVDVAGLPALLRDMQEKLTLIQTQSTSLDELSVQLEMAKVEYVKAAEALSAKRKKAAATLEKSIMEELGALKMAGTMIRIAVDPLVEADWQAYGMDKVTFLAATNPGSAPAPLAKIASGGELSRFMLALKVAMRDVRGVGTVIFDEIDTGTGGAVADAIGKRLAKLGETAQVLVVTHLPQVAAKGNHHLKISKAVSGKTTRTQVELLSEKDRREELARMLAGADITDEARAAATKLIAG